MVFLIYPVPNQAAIIILATIQPLMHYCGILILTIYVQQHEVCLSNDALKIFSLIVTIIVVKNHTVGFFFILNPVILYSDHWFFFLHILPPTFARKVQTNYFINICFEKVSVMIFLLVRCLSIKIQNIFIVCQ